MDFKKFFKSVKKHTGDIAKSVIVTVITSFIVAALINGQNHNNSADNTKQDNGEAAVPLEPDTITEPQHNDSPSTTNTSETFNTEYQGLRINKDESIVLFKGYFSFGLIGIDYGHKATINFNLNKNTHDVLVGDSIPFTLGKSNYHAIIREVNLEYGYIKIDVYKL